MTDTPSGDRNPATDPTSGQTSAAEHDHPPGNGHAPVTMEFLAEWRNAAYNCFSSGHKFCREVCPVVPVTRNASW
jgi:hypothetical protein